MKRKFFGLVAMVGMLFATSCSDDLAGVTSDGDEMTVSFSVGVENVLNSRAISDGLTADKLVYQLFDANGNALYEAPVVLENVTFPYEALTLRLVKGQTYQIAFWAQNSECTAYDTSDLTAVKVDYNGVNNDETRDAFFKTEKFTVTNDMKIASTLGRPFAQINVGVTDDDWEGAKGMAFTKSQVIIAKAADTINLLTGAVSGDAPITYSVSAMPVTRDTPEVLTVNTADGKATFNYLSMSYILAPDVTSANGSSKTTLESLEFAFTNEAGDKTVTLKDGLTNVPVQRNWRTNIVGTFLTSDVNFEIIIEPDYNGDNNYPEYSSIAEGVSYDKTSKTLYISSAEGLVWFMNATNTPKNITVNAGSPMTVDEIKAIAGTNGTFANLTVKLTADIDMKGKTFTPLHSKPSTNGLQCTFDGCNHTISNLSYTSKVQGAHVGFIAKLNGTVKNLKLDNVKFTGINYIGGVVGGLYGSITNCHVTNSTMTATLHTDNGEAADVGGIVGFLRDTYGNIEDCTVSSTSVTGARDVGGIVGKYQGYADSNHITGCVLNDVEILVSIPKDYAEYDKVYNRGRGQAETFGPVAGYVMYNTVPTTNLDGSANPDNNYLYNVDITVLDANKSDEPVTTKSALSLYTALAAGCTNVTLAPGEYDLKQSPLYDTGNMRFNKYFTAAVTLNAEGVTTTTSELSPNFWGATINGLHINPAATDKRTIKGCFSGTFNNCSFIGGMYTESKETPATFNNCYFYCEDVVSPGYMAFHIGLLNAGNTVTLNNCTIDGRCDFGVTGDLVFNDCTLEVKANWELYGTGTYTFENCTINYAEGAQIVNKEGATIIGL